MKPTQPLRALACAALSFMAGAAFAAQYTAIELPAKPAAKHGAYNDVMGSVLAADGRAIIHASTFFKDDTSVGVAELCSAVGDVCKKREPDKDVFYGAASSDFKRLAGNLYDAAGNFSAVRQQKGVLEVLVAQASALGINRKGVTVGVKGDEAFLFDTELHLLPGLSDGYTVAYAINDNGVVVGRSVSSLPHETRAVRWDKGQVSLVQTNIPQGLGFGSVATVVTPAGTIYGSSSFHDRGTTQHAVRFSTDGTAQSLGALNANQGNTSEVLAANPQGASVGWSTNYPSDGTQQAVLFKEGQVLELATAVPEEVRAKYAFLFATAINDAGQILVAALRRPSYEGVMLRLDPQP